MEATYLATARLLTQLAPVVFASGLFALKGGTAINLFLRDLPRLSVDLDLVFLDHRRPRAQALAAIAAALGDVRTALKREGYAVQVLGSAPGDDTKLVVRREHLLVKVEVNTVIRGTIHPPQMRSLSPAASDALRADVELPLLADAEIYGGKLVAALDRQHPRDLFDVLQLYAHGGITPDMRRAFVVYLASHNRTVHEVLFPSRKPLRLAYEGSFSGMTSTPVTLDDLVAVRERLCAELPASLDEAEREFLRSLVRARPAWSLLGIPHAADLPALRWRLENLRELERTQPARFRALASALDERLAGA